MTSTTPDTRVRLGRLHHTDVCLEPILIVGRQETTQPTVVFYGYTYRPRWAWVTKFRWWRLSRLLFDAGARLSQNDSWTFWIERPHGVITARRTCIGRVSKRIITAHYPSIHITRQAP